MTAGLSHIAALLRKDILLEIRQQYTFYGILLYVASTIFVLYLAMGDPDAAVWNGLFWMIQLFICVNAVAKSFLQESSGRMLYYYSIAGARDYIIAKLIFNALLMVVMSVTSLLLFRLLMGDVVQHPWKIYRHSLPWWYKSQPGIFVSIGHCRAGKAECRDDRDTWFSADHSADIDTDANLECCLF